MAQVSATTVIKLTVLGTAIKIISRDVLLFSASQKWGEIKIYLNVQILN